jgi:DNA-directed RNA polymerase subunit RPC12/RpoP
MTTYKCPSCGLEIKSIGLVVHKCEGARVVLLNGKVISGEKK